MDRREMPNSVRDTVSFLASPSSLFLLLFLPNGIYLTCRNLNVDRVFESRVSGLISRIFSKCSPPL